MRTRLIFRYIFIVLSISLMGYIFIMSSQTAAASTQSSGRVIRKIAEVIVADFEQKPVDYQLDYISSLQYFVRKTAHFVLYFGLGFSVCGSALTFADKTVFHKSLISFVIAFLYAVSDEVHQLFVEGRSGQISDVLLDSVGIIFGILFINFMFSFIKIVFVGGKTSEQ